MKRDNQPMRIVARIDTLQASYEALDEALSLAARVPQAEVHIAAIPEGGTGPLPSETTEQRARTAQRQIVAALSERMKEGKIHEGIQFSLEVMEGEPSEQLSALAERVHADMLVIAASGSRGLRDMVFGSLQRQFLKTGICPVLLVPEEGHRHEAAAEEPQPKGEPTSEQKAVPTEALL